MAAGETNNQGTILLVDDTPASIGIVQAALEKAGYRVAIATSGEKALQRAALIKPALILLDVLMPGMDGYETCRRLKAQEATREIPVIFLSALTDTFDKVKGFGLGAVDYLIKPAALEELLARVQTHLTINRLEQELQEANRTLEVRVATRTAELAAANAALRQEAAERKRAEEGRRQAAEQQVMLEFAMDRVQEAAYLVDADGRFHYVNGAASRSLGYSREELLRMRVADIDPDLPLVSWATHMGDVSAAGAATFEGRHRTKDGSIFPVEINSNYLQYNGNAYLMALARDITKRKQAEEERLSHLRFFESMDRVNRAIQGGAVEQMMESVLDVALDIFGCDRSWLVYPCDPEAPTWCVPMERTRPEYPGALGLGDGDIPMDADLVEAFRTMRASSGPVKFGKHYPRTLGEVQDRYETKSQISMAIYPKLGKPWMFGLHQCSYDRVWTPEEERLFQEIGRRISDALSSLLSFRDLRENEQKYHEIFDNVSDSLTLYNVTAGGRFVLADMNPCAAAIMGLSKPEAAGRFFEDTVSRQLAAHRLPLLRQCLDSGEPITYDEDLELPQGARSLHTTLLPVRNESGSIYRLIVFNRDITQRRVAEKQAHLLLHEVNHRAKNLLAVVQAIVRQTAKDRDLNLFEMRVNERIAALAAGHDLLVGNEWRGVDTGKLVAVQLAHFKDLIGSRVIIKGPPALLTPAASQALGMALHELATNAGKYGALSCAAGTVRVEWEIAGNDKGAFFRIRWTERNGPPPKEPQHHGLGHRVIVQMAEYALDGEVSLTYPSTGLVWELTAPVAGVIGDGSLPAPLTAAQLPDAA